MGTLKLTLNKFFKNENNIIFINTFQTNDMSPKLIEKYLLDAHDGDMTYLEAVSIATSMVDYLNSQLIWQLSSRSNARNKVWKLNWILKTKGCICSIMDVYINDQNPVDDLGDLPSLFEGDGMLYNKLNSVLIAWLQEDFTLDTNKVELLMKTIDDDEISLHASAYEK